MEDSTDFEPIQMDKITFDKIINSIDTDNFKTCEFQEEHLKNGAIKNVKDNME